jgi:SAM-dependent methyltransferase
VTATTAQPGSSSLQHPDYWWHRARAGLLQEVFEPFLGDPRQVLDVGSADAPSVGWLRGEHRLLNLDLLPGGLVPGAGVCGSVTDLPFADATFDVVGAFDVVEHCEDDHRAVRELARVTVPGGRVLVSVPAYSWAWTDHDDRAGHHHRYTRRSLVQVVEAAGLTVLRATYAFGAVFPLFVVERGSRRFRAGRGAGRSAGRSAGAASPSVGNRLPDVSPGQDRLLTGLCRLDQRVLRHVDLPFGSSVFLAAVKPG